MLDFIDKWGKLTGLSVRFFLDALSVSRQNYNNWRARYGCDNLNNSKVTRSNQILPEERAKIIAYHSKNSFEGYRRLTYMMMDENVAYVSPSTTYRVLTAAGLIRSKKVRKSKKGTGFKQPTIAHSQWHTDITYIKIKSVFYYLILVLDGFSRYLTGWDLREKND